MAERRTLTLTHLDQVMPDVDRLLNGHRAAGNWSLGQICNHLGAAVRFSVEGFPFRAPWLVRKTLGPRYKRRVLKSGQMPEGIQLPDAARPKPNLDARAEAEALRASLRLFAAHHGPFADHPFFGPMSQADWERLHCIHCAHHLSFLWPG